MKQLSHRMNRFLVPLAIIAFAVVCAVAFQHFSTAHAQVTYSWVNTGETAWDVGTPCFSFTSCHINCDATTVGTSCTAAACQGTYVTAADGSLGNMLVDTFMCTASGNACVANQGQSCSSPASPICGNTTTGTVQCDGSCSASTAPPDVDQCTGPQDPGIQCSSSQCTAACVAYQGSPCTSASNSCGMTNNGTYQCDGSCSASAPPNSACTCTADPTCGGTRASTCSTTNCSDSCGNSYPGQMICAGPPPPTANLSVTPPSGPAGTNPTLTWNSTNATSCTSPDFVTGSATSGSTPAGSQATNKTFHLTCTGAGGTANATATFTVGGASCSGAGPVNITATPTRVQSGNSSTLNWSGANLLGASCTITNASTGAIITTSSINSCNVSGSTNTGPLTNQTAYTITCGGQTATVVVNVVPKFKEF